MLPHTNKVTANLSPPSRAATVLDDPMTFKCKISLVGPANTELFTSKKKFKVCETLVL